MRWLAILLLVALAPSARADEPCGASATTVEPAPGAPLRVDVEERDCPEGRSREIAVQDPDGRTVVVWHDDERGRGLGVFRPPRVWSWSEDERGCAMLVSAFGVTELPCAAGSPPPLP